jgi:TetR/AcrR family transcriptional repressor of nem operon
LGKATAELAGTDPDVAARARETYEALEALLTTSILQAQRQGDVDLEANARQLALLLLTVMRGLEALGRSGLDEHSLRLSAEGAIALIPRQRPVKLAPG